MSLGSGMECQRPAVGREKMKVCVECSTCNALGTLPSCSSRGHSSPRGSKYRRKARHGVREGISSMSLAEGHTTVSERKRQATRERAQSSPPRETEQEAQTWKGNVTPKNRSMGWLHVSSSSCLLHHTMLEA